MLSKLKKALMLGAKLSTMSKKDAEHEMKKILAVSKVSARHAKDLVSKAQAAACKQRKKIEREVKAELKKSEKCKRKTNAKGKTSVKRKTDRKSKTKSSKAKPAKASKKRK